MIEVRFTCPTIAEAIAFLNGCSDGGAASAASAASATSATSATVTTEKQEAARASTGKAAKAPPPPPEPPKLTYETSGVAELIALLQAKDKGALKELLGKHGGANPKEGEKPAFSGKFVPVDNLPALKADLEAAIKAADDASDVG